MREFSLLGFVEHLAVMTVEIDHAETHGLEKAARIVQAEAKASVGTYQAAAGPFAAWAPLAASTQDQRQYLGFPADEPELRTGGLRDSIQYTVDPQRGLSAERIAEVGSNDPVMEYQELGTPTIPPRSILGGAAVRTQDEVAGEIGEAYVSALLIGSGSSIAGSFLPIRRRR
jgi:hypothetical protein